jgi:hypothetical protein
MAGRTQQDAYYKREAAAVKKVIGGSMKIVKSGNNKGYLTIK